MLIYSAIGISYVLIAVIATNLWRGKLNNLCRTTAAPVQGIWQIDKNYSHNCGKCPVGSFCGNGFDWAEILEPRVGYERMEAFGYGYYSFDNFFSSLVVLFQISTFDDWY